MTMRVLGIIPARGGSVGVARKNVRPLCGRPLLAYTAEAALAARRLDRVVLSTDDEEIAETGRQCGVDVPFMRPACLARDDTPMLPVVQHALRALDDAESGYDAVCLLQPTSPMRLPDDIDACVELLANSDADSVVTVLEVPHEHNPHWVYFEREDGLMALSTGEASPIPRRQDLPRAFCREGSVYVTRVETLLDRNSLYGDKIRGFPIDARRSVNIDTPEDWRLAELRMRERSAVARRVKA